MSNQKEGVFWVIEEKIYAYPSGGVDSMVEQIKMEFNLVTEPRIIYDGSIHYRCYLDGAPKKKGKRNDNSSGF